MYGWTGKILKVDVGAKSFETICLPAEVYQQWLGGRGLVGYFLSMAGALEWSDPNMPLMLFTGPLTGTPAPTSGHLILGSRSPLTGAVYDESVGGVLGTRLKAAGWDGLIVTGQADSWLGIEIENEQVHLTTAEHLISHKHSVIAHALADKGAYAAIGPAAHNGVRYSSVVVDRHFAAVRGGMGLCFAQKKLKYISVKGSNPVAVADENKLNTAREDILRLTSASSILLGEHGFSNKGTAALYDLVHHRRMMPTANFRRTFFESAPTLNAFAIFTAYGAQGFGCEGCHILCKKRGTDSSVTGIPEYDALVHFTALLENNALEVAVEAVARCGEYGMDPVSAAATLACYSEIRGERLSGPRILQLLEDIGEGKGEGASLGQGSRRFSMEQGRPEISMSVKGLELPGFDPRGAYGLALAYATSTIGGSASRANPIGHEILRKPVATDRFSFSGKARIIKISEDQNAATDALVACPFIFLAASLEEYAAALEAVTGMPTTAAELNMAGERICYNERLLNAQFGLTADDDDLPVRFFTESGSRGPAFDVPPISRRDFLEARDRYYRVRGLDCHGMPNAETAERLGLVWNS